MKKADNIHLPPRKPVYDEMPPHMHIPVAFGKLLVMLSALRVLLQGAQRLI